MSIPFESDRPFDVDKFEIFLQEQLPQDIFRAKGILWFNDSELRHIFQLSGPRFDIKAEEWPTPPKNQLVFIGRNLKAEELQQKLANCHELEEFEVAKEELVLSRNVAVSVEGDLAGTIENSLDLGEVVAVQERFGGGFFKFGENAIFLQVSVESFLDLGGEDFAVEFAGELGSDRVEGAIAVFGDWHHRSGARKSPLAKQLRVEGTDNFKGGKAIFEQVR